MFMRTPFRRAGIAALSLALIASCAGPENTHPSHDIEPLHGYDIAGNWDPDAAHVTVADAMAINAVRDQAILIATVSNGENKPLGGRRVEWMIPEGGVGGIVGVHQHGVYTNRGVKDVSGLMQAGLGDKLTNTFAVTHTAAVPEVLDMGNDDPADDIILQPGQTWVSITSSVEGTTDMIAYAPGINNWADHKAFVTRHWMDVSWAWPTDATNRAGTDHKLTTAVTKHSDGTALSGYLVTYKLTSGPAATFEPGGKDFVTVTSDGNGMATATLKQVKPVAGANTVAISIVRPGNKDCCEPEKFIAAGGMTKTWVTPSIAIKKTAPAQAAIGDQFAYAITVSNGSDISTRDTIVTDVLPDGIAYVASTPAAKVDGQKLSWALGTIDAGGSRDLAVTVKATKTGKFTNCAEVTAESGLTGKSCADTVVVAPALSLVKTAPADVLLCDGITYTYVVKNGGDGVANNVKIADALPAGMTAEGGANAVNINVGALKAGESKTFTVKTSVAKTGEYMNKASATADGGLKADASAKTMVHQPVLAITKKAPATSFIGRPFTYEITVTNNGDAVSAQTVLVDTLPAGARFVSASDNGTHNQGKVTWLLGDLAPKATKTVTCVVSSTQAVSLVNKAAVKGNCATEVTAQATTDVQGIPAVLLEVIDLADPIEVGANETYEITVTNQGSAIDQNIVIKATLPAEMSFVSASGPVSFSNAGQVVTFQPLASLAPGAKVVFKVTGKANAAADARFAVEMTSTSLTSPVNETEATRLY